MPGHIGHGFFPRRDPTPFGHTYLKNPIRYAWNPKQPFINGCFNWMIPNPCIGNGCFTKHLFINGCLGFQVLLECYPEHEIQKTSDGIEKDMKEISSFIEKIHSNNIKIIEKQHLLK